MRRFGVRVLYGMYILDRWGWLVICNIKFNKPVEYLLMNVLD